MVLLCVCFTFSICISVSSHFCAPIFTFLDSYHSVRPFVWGFVLILVRRCFVFDISYSSGYCQWLRSYKFPWSYLTVWANISGDLSNYFGFESAHLTSGLPFVLFPKRMFFALHWNSSVIFLKACQCGGRGVGGNLSDDLMKPWSAASAVEVDLRGMAFSVFCICY